MKGGSSPFSLLLAGILIVAFSSGCDRYARHKILTFFFTGVPPLDRQENAPETDREAEKRAQEEKRRPKKRSVVRATRFSHGPYASGACYLCHESSESGALRAHGKQVGAETSVAKAGTIPGRLVAPVRELCVACHETKSAEDARRGSLWVHGPVSAGLCTLCHGPHSGPYPYLLLKKANESCLGCHAEGFVFSKALHEGKEECLSCHNAHFGRNSRLLTTEYREPW